MIHLNKRANGFGGGGGAVLKQLKQSWHPAEHKQKQTRCKSGLVMAGCTCAMAVINAVGSAVRKA